MSRDHNDLIDMLRMMGMNVEDDDSIPVDATVEKPGSSTSSQGTGGGARPPHHDSHLVDRLAQWSRRALVFVLVALVLVGIACYWWFHPALNFQSQRVWSWVLLAAVVTIFALKIASLRSERHGKLFSRLIAVPVAVFVAFFLGILMGQPFMPGNAERFATVLKTQ